MRHADNVMPVSSQHRCGNSKALDVTKASDLGEMEFDGDDVVKSFYDRLCLGATGSSSDDMLWICSDVTATASKPNYTWILAGILPWPLLAFCCWLTW
jgi:hypothetical protein